MHDNLNWGLGRLPWGKQSKCKLTRLYTFSFWDSSENQDRPGGLSSVKGATLSGIMNEKKSSLHGSDITDDKSAPAQPPPHCNSSGTGVGQGFIVCGFSGCGQRGQVGGTVGWNLSHKICKQGARNKREREARVRSGTTRGKVFIHEGVKSWSARCTIKVFTARLPHGTSTGCLAHVPGSLCVFSLWWWWCS